MKNPNRLYRVLWLSMFLPAHLCHAETQVSSSFLSDLELRDDVVFLDERPSVLHATITVDPVATDETKRPVLVETNKYGIPIRDIGELHDDGKSENGDDLWGDSVYNGKFKLHFESDQVGKHYYRVFLGRHRLLDSGSSIAILHVAKRVASEDFEKDKAELQAILKKTVPDALLDTNGNLTEEAFNTSKDAILELLYQSDRVKTATTNDTSIRVEFKSGHTVYVTALPSADQR